MWNFVSLTKLQMDNNIIEKIEGLDKLVNLEWLGNKTTNIFYCFDSLHYNRVYTLEVWGLKPTLFSKLDEVLKFFFVNPLVISKFSPSIKSSDCHKSTH